MTGASVTSSDSFLELMGGVSKISDQYSLLMSLIALAGAIFLIIKTMLGNLVARSSEIGILKAVGWTERNVQKQLMGEALLQSFIGGVAGLIVGYSISYALGFLSIPVSTPWEIDLMPAFAKDTETAAARRGTAAGEHIGRTDRRRTRRSPFLLGLSQAFLWAGAHRG